MHPSAALPACAFRLMSCLLLGLALAAGAATDPAPARPTVEELLRQARALDANEPVRAVAVAREALALAQQTARPVDELLARAQLSEALRRNSDYAGARAIVDAGLAQPAGTDPAMRAARAQLVYASGQIFWNRGDYPAAEACYLEAQRTAEELKDTPLFLRVLNSRGIVARQQKLFEQAEQFHRTALALAEQNRLDDLRLQIRNNLAILLYDQQRFDEARPLLLENLRVHTAANNRRSMANALINLGALENTAKNPAGALPFFEQALTLRLELGVPRHIASARLSVASTLARLGRGEEALAQLRTAAPLAEKVGSHELFGNLYSAFSEAYAATGDYRAALEYQRKAQTENDIISGENTAKTIAELRERFDAEKRSREIAELHATQAQKDADLALKESDLHRARLQRYGLAALLALGAATALAIISRQRAITRAERRVLAETRRARDAAEEAAALKTRLLDLASHDLKAPLVGTMMTADLIAEASADRPDVAGQARSLRAESQRMLGFVQDLLDGSAAEAGQLVLERTSLDLAALAAEIATAFGTIAAGKQQRLTVTAASPAQELRVCGDAARLRQVIENLVSNALKFSPAGTTVQLTLARVDGHVHLAVRDEGPGLTAEDRAGLFQRFRRLSAVPTGGEPSTGLGLALARELVAAHGGRIEVDSVPSQGATFAVVLPAESAG